METPHVSPQKAVNRGLWTIVVPSMTVLTMPVVVFVVLVKLEYLGTTAPGGMNWALPAFLVSSLGSWLVWSTQVPRWRLWAYRRVNDVVSLKRLAVESRIVWPDGSFFERTEIMSRQVRDELRNLEAASMSRGA